MSVRITRKGVETSEGLGRHHWIVEACLNWRLGNRRLIRSYDRTADHFHAFANLARALLTYRRLLTLAKMRL